MVAFDSLRATTPSAQVRLKYSAIAVVNRSKSAASTSRIVMLTAKQLAMTSGAATFGALLIVDEALMLKFNFDVYNKVCLALV